MGRCTILLMLLLVATFMGWNSAAVINLNGISTRNLSTTGMHMPDFTSAHEAGCRKALLEQSSKSFNTRLNKAKPANHTSLLLLSLKRDTERLASFNRRITRKVTKSVYLSANRTSQTKTGAEEEELWQAESTVESGASLGAGEYFMDAFVGTPPRHFSFIIDTGSDLTWLQSKPCYDCFDQVGPVFDPSESSSYKAVSCTSAECDSVPRYECTDSLRSCRYLYSYGDSSKTSGDLAYETLSIHIAEHHDRNLEIRDMVIGLGHSNKGLFHGAGGLLGLGQGPLSFASQLKTSSLGHAFSYCLVDRTSNLSVSSSISFGDEFALSKHFQHMQFTPFVRTNNSVDTFYYLGITGIKVDNETLHIDHSEFSIAENGSRGTIIDSGTTLTYLSKEAYRAVYRALSEKITYTRTDPFDILDVCYNTSGVYPVRFPAFRIVFTNGVEMVLPHQNYFIQPDPEQPLHCLAILPTDGLSIIGNFQQQNIHLLYDVKNSRLGFANTNCAAL